MTDDVKRRLEGLQDDLAEIAESGSKPFGFGIVTASTPVKLPYPNGWKFLEFWLEKLLEPKEPIRPQPLPWYDPFPDGSACVRWWGDAKGIGVFQSWAGKAARLLPRSTNWPSNLEVLPGYHGMLAAFVRFAEQDPDLAEDIDYRKLADLNERSVEDRAFISKTLLREESLPTFSVKEIKISATRFVAKMLARLLGDPVRQPRLSVDIKESTVKLDGVTYGVDLVYVLVLHKLLEARGVPITRRSMQESDKTLALENRLDRRIGQIRTGKDLPFKIPIMTADPKSRGYSLPPAYLA